MVFLQVLLNFLQFQKYDYHPPKKLNCLLVVVDFADVAKPIIKANSNQIYEQTNMRQHTVRLKIGGQATVFKGTKLKVRCPVKKFDR